MPHTESQDSFLADQNDDDRALLYSTPVDRQLYGTLFVNEQYDKVVAFTKSHNLGHKTPLFKRAAALIQSSKPASHHPSITTLELEALEKESQRKWSQPWTLYFTILICSIGAIEQGTAQTSMNGANLYFPKEFGIGSESPKDKLIVGLINSGIYVSVGIFGAWLSEPINNRLGRRGAIFVGSCICLIANIASALSQSWQTLLAFRFLLGSGLGINTSTISVYAAECAPPFIRGGLAVSWQMFTAFGLFLGFIANVAVYNVSSPWRLQLAFPLIPTIPLVALIFFCPESPAWLIKRRKRYDLAFSSLDRLRNTEIQAAKEVYSTYLQNQTQTITTTNPSYLKKVFQLFTIPRIRRATLASYTVMLSQQLCGINIIAFYSSSIFLSAGFTPFTSLLSSTVFGLVNFLFAFPAIWTMDTLGRRSLLLLTLPFMALTMFAAALSFAIPAENPARFGILVSMIYLFCAEYSPGMGPVPVAYSAEVFPLSHREVGMSFAVSVANIWASILSLTFPQILSVLKARGAFSLYAGLNVLAFGLVFLFVPETKMRTLEELDEVFEIPSGRFIEYQTLEYLPWWVRRYVLRKDVKLNPLEGSLEYNRLSQEDEHGGEY